MRVFIVAFGLILYLVSMPAFFYGMGAFANWQLNPGEWSFDARVSVVLSFSICFFALLPITTISLLGVSERHAKT